MKKLLSRVFAVALAMTMSLSAAAVNPSAKAIRTSDGKTVEVTGKQNILKKLPPVNMVQKTAKVANLVSVGRPYIKRNHAVAATPLKKMAARELMGCVLYSTDPTFVEGYYTLPTSGTCSVELIEESKGLSVWGAAAYDGVLYCVSVINSLFGTIVYQYQIDLDTWAVLAADNAVDFSTVASSYAADPETGDIYGVFYDADGTGMHFGILDPEELTSSEICPMDEPLYLAFDEEGTLYGINDEGILYEVNTATGELLKLAETDVINNYISGMAIDGQTIYYSVCTDEEAALYAIDLETFEAAKVYDFENYEEVSGLFVPAPAAAEGAPNVPTDVEVAIDDDLSGTVTFTAPDETYAGDALTGDLTYIIYESGSVLATGTCTAGLSTEVAVKLAAGGPYSIRVACKNAAGEGPKTKAVKGWAGSLVPPYDVTFDSEESVLGYDVIDANEDGIIWGADETGALIQYNPSEAMDDYLVTPPFSFEKGMAYTLSVITNCAASSYPERIEVVVATDNTLEAMRDGIVVIAPTDVTWDSPEAIEGDIAVPATGKYYIGFHGISDADKFYLYLHGYSVSAPFAGVTPRVVEDVNFDVFTTGEPSVTISFKAPTLDINGDALAALTKVDVLCDGEVVKTFDTVAPGQECSFTYEAEAPDFYTFSIIASNAEGEGKTFTEKVWVGVNFAAAPKNARVSEWANAPGKVTVSWEGVAEDIDGNAISADLITYLVLDRNQEVVAEDVPCKEECELEFDAVPEGEQEFVLYYIIPVTARGENVNNGGYAYTPLTPVGTPYSMPMVESFPEGTVNYLWETRIDAGTGWSWSVYASIQDITPVDDDGGMIAWWPFPEAAASLISGKVLIDEAETVAYSFFYHTNTDEGYNIMPFVMVGGFEYDLLDEPICTEAEVSEWRQCIIPMVDYCGTEVRVGIHAVCNIDEGRLILDQIAVKNMIPYDLAASNISAPKGIDADKTATITAEVTNQGMAEAEGFSIQFYRNGEAMGEAIAADMTLAPGQSTIFTATDKYTPFADPEYTYYFEVIWAEDGDDSNNISQNAIVRVSQPMYPEVDDLEATADGTEVTLSWSAPQTEGAVQAIVDDVEDYEEFAIDQAGDWTFYDLDGSDNYGFQGINYPGAGAPASFIVFDESINADLSGKIAHSGTKAFACFAAVNGPNNDWMVSPKLPGVAQTISFYAKTYMDYGLERFNFYYSTTDDALSSMIQVGETNEVPLEWTEYSFEVPEGAVYFAIQCVSNDVFIFLVDDISFTVGGGDYTIESYNVYRDGELLANTTETTYVDANAPQRETRYNVTVVYKDKGESAPSNTAVVFEGGVKDIANGSIVRVEGRRIIVENAERVVITAADGKVVTNAIGEAKVEANVGAGVYVVKTNDRTNKVIVK